MKVNLAAQCISSSVADALDFCCSHLKLAQFQATSKFLHILDHLFVFTNSRNPSAQKLKALLRKSDFGYIDNLLMVTTPRPYIEAVALHHRRPH